MAEQKPTLDTASKDQLLIALERARADNNLKAVNQIMGKLVSRFDYVEVVDTPPPAAEKQTNFGDYVKSLGSGIYQGAVSAVDLPAQVGELAVRGSEKAYEKITGNQSPEFFQEVRNQLELPIVGSMLKQRATEAAQTYTPSAIGYEPKTDVGESIQRIGNFLVFSGGKPIVQGVLPALASEKVSEARGIQGTNLEVPLEIATAVLTPIITKSIISPTGGQITGETKKALAILANEGIIPTAAQRTGSRKAAFVEQSTEAGMELVEQANANFSKAALKRIGVNASYATPELMQEAYQRIGTKLNNTIGNVTGKAAKTDVDNLADILKQYSGQVGPVNRAPVFTQIYQAFQASAKSGQKLSNNQIRTFHQTLNGLTRRGDETGSAAREVIGVLNQFISKNLGKEGSALWKQANVEYRDFLAIEDALSKAAGSTGLVTPQNLRTSAKTVFGKRGLVLGRSELAELAKAGSSALKPLPSSGTAERLMAAGQGPTSGIGAGAAAQSFGLPPEMVGMAVLGGTYAPKGYSTFSASPVGQAYLQNQLISNLDKMSLARYLAATNVQ
jgi:hypothetical protein